MKTICLILLLAPAICHSQTASWYGAECARRLQADGTPFDPSKLTCASWFYPLSTRLLVTHAGKSVECVVCDRGPARRLVKAGRLVDLSEAAFRRLADTREGVIQVEITRLAPKPAVESKKRPPKAHATRLKKSATL